MDKLTLDSICETALLLGDSRGSKVITMRRVAEELGVTTMALYTYVDSKEELLVRMTDFALDRIEIPPLQGDWRADVVMILEELRQRLRDHPAIVSIISSRPVTSRSQGLARLMEHLLQVLSRGYGDTDDVINVFTLLYRYTFGYVIFEIPRTDSRHSGLAEIAEQRGLRMLAESIGAIDSSLRKEQFGDGVRAIVDGYQKLAGLTIEGAGPAEEVLRGL